MGGPGAPPQPQGQGGAPGMPPGTQAVPVPPQFRDKIDPNNRLQQLMLQRLDSLTPGDVQALDAAPPQVVQALKKLMPEVGFALDQLGQGGGQGGGMQSPGGAPGGGMGGGGPPAPQLANGAGMNVPPAGPDQAGSPGLPQPKTRLGGM